MACCQRAENRGLQNGDHRWILPGKRWRVSCIEPGACFELEIHVDESTSASVPQAVRTAWLDDVAQVLLDDAAALTKLLTKVGAGGRYLAQGSFDFDPLLRAAMADSSRTLLWHPLASAGGRYAPLIVRSLQPVGLPEYLGRDHAVIEAAPSGILRGKTEHATWLRSALARHLALEEELLFPAYLRAGGNAGWVRAVRNEHQHLRRHLDTLHETSAQRRFLLLLDGHDEKEEQIVHPDIPARLGDQADGLTAASYDTRSVQIAKGCQQGHTQVGLL